MVDLYETLSEDQKEVYRNVKENKINTFVSGQGGHGKSYLAKAMQDKRTVVAAPTGIAAINCGGVTIHSAFGLPIGGVTPNDFSIVPKQMSLLFGKGSQVNQIQFDEMGMIRADYLHLIDMRLRKLKDNNIPFGGIQVTGFGDFFQIEPILDASSKEYWDKKTYKSHFCFDSPSWDFKEYELTTPHRHANHDHVNILRSIRCKDENFKDAFAELKRISQEYDPSSEATVLCNYNNDADTINLKKYSQLKGLERSYFGKVEGAPLKPTEMLVPQLIKLKVGARVIICANDMDKEYVNGDQGIVVEMDSACVYVRLDSGRTVAVKPFDWEKNEIVNEPISGLTRKTVSSYRQIPIKLGYAISVHKSQGLTFENLAIDAGKGSFAHGQFYVSISRIKNLEKLQFINKKLLSEKNVIVRQAVIDWYKGVKK